MNRQEMIFAGLLFLALMGWLFLQQQQAGIDRRMAEERARHEQRVLAAKALRTDGADTGGVERAGAELPPASNQVPHLVAGAPGPAAEPGTEPRRHEADEKTLSLTNGQAEIVLSSWGGGIVSVTLNDYRQTVQKDSPPVRFDFSHRPALAFSGLAGLSTNHDFTVTSAGGTVTVERVTESGVRFARSVSLEPGYRVSVVDVFANPGTNAIPLPAHAVALGPMREPSETSTHRERGQDLEVDTQPYQSGRRVESWGSAYFSEQFGIRSSRFGCGCTPPNLAGVPPAVSPPAVDAALDWAAVKSKFFVQILAPEGGTSGYRLHATRETDGAGFVLSSVSAELLFGARELPPGGELRRSMSYYVGPKKYDLLKDLGQHQDLVMLKAWAGWGWYRTLCIWVLWTLNKLNAVFHSYGLAIILVTLIVRVLFWPVTHMGAKSMKKMQELQPLMQELKTKYKDDPQKMHQETMLLYRKHKVNPAAGCLPMLVQMPVFIALFSVLRSAVELRFAPFLWISDLSEPEGLLRGVIPAILGGELNALPLLMTATSFLQNRLTPSSADPQQKMMMNLMPIMYLVFFYKMASGLCLYWTVSQILAIAQLAWQRRGGAGPKKDRALPPTSAGVPPGDGRRSGGTPASKPAVKPAVVAARWSAEKALQWSREQPWMVGCNYVPSNAVNQLAMWQEGQMDLARVRQELGWAASLGFNTVRVFLHDLAYQADPAGFKKRVRRFLKIAESVGIRAILVLFDDCWNPSPALGRQPDPVPHLANSRWLQSPGLDALERFPQDSELRGRLETYVKDLLTSFAPDERVRMWDLYNEPGGMLRAPGRREPVGERCLPLLKAVFEWAREASPRQPVTSGLFNGDWRSGRPGAVSRLQLERSDVISFHHYDPADVLEKDIPAIRALTDRPLICTEYLARPLGSRFETILPILKRERIGAISWGLVAGKTQTIYPWDSWEKPYDREPDLWFHDILRTDGRPFDEQEVAFLRSTIAGK